MNISLAQFNLLKQQFRTWHTPRDAVLEIAANIPRNLFVPKPFESLAFTDIRIPLAHRQFMLTPKEEIGILDALPIEPSHRVLEIGTGSGYFTALLAQMALHVDSIDIFADFSEQAKCKLDSLAIKNVSLITGDALNLAITTSYDAIVLTGSLPFLPNQFHTMIAKGGHLIAILGVAPVMTVIRLDYAIERNWRETLLFETLVEPLVNAPPNTPFRF